MLTNNQNEEILNQNQDEIQNQENEQTTDIPPETSEQEQKPEVNLEEIDKKLDEDLSENELTKLKEQFKNNFTNYRENKYKVHTIKIDEKYISEQPPEIQKILRPIKGDILSERALKNYINAQLFIEKQKASKQDVSKETYTQQVSQQTSQPVQTDILKTDDFNRALYMTLKVKYNDLPELDNDTSPEEQLKDYLTDLQISDPIKYYKFLKDYDLASQKIQEQISQYKYIEENWEHISAENIKKDVQKFENDLKEYGLTLQDLGLNLELDDKYYNEYLYNNILLKNNEANPEVVQKISDKALLIPEGAVYKKLIELNFKNILSLAKSKNASSGINKKVPPSMSTYYSAGNKNVKTSIPVEDILDLPSYEIDDETLQKYKEQLKSQIVGLK